MAQDISLLGAVYSDVPSVLLPKQGGGTAQFDDTTDADATASDILSGKTAYVNGVKITGTGTGGGGSVTQDQDGFIVLPSTGSGGGGGGDYSTAEVTIVSSHGIDTYFPMPIEANTWGQGQPPLLECIAQSLFSGVYTVVLYKGGLYTSLTSDYSFDVSGDITEIGGGEYLITGDCTITGT